MASRSGVRGGCIGALLGAELAKALDVQKLLLLFGLLMILVGLAIFRRRDGAGDTSVRSTADTVRTLLPLLVGIGFVVAAASSSCQA
jgi:uncharacterized membrane protein YfcA